MSWLMKTAVPYACLYIDITWRNVFQCLECIITSSENEVERKNVLHNLQKLWTTCSHASNILVTLSVRSALDMYLKVKNFPTGSEVIMTSINIPDVASIVVHHGLVVVPCDIDPSTLAPDIHKLKDCITEKTVAILIAHIYGRRIDMAPIIKVCKPHSVEVIEDCAEGFSGLSYTGHEGSDIATFSFGTIKHCTAFGGAISKIKSRETFESMATLQEAYPMQSRFTYALKFFKCCVLACALNTPLIVRLGIFLFRLLGINHKQFVVSKLRGFPKNLFKGIRHKPCLAMLRFLSLRLQHYTDEDYAVIIKKGDYVTDRLPAEVFSIGCHAHYCGYWLFPILVERPNDIVEFLNNKGVDATRGSTQLQVVNGTTKDRSNSILSRFIMDHVLYIPVHKRVPFDQLDKIVLKVKQAVIHLGCKRLQLPKTV